MANWVGLERCGLGLDRTKLDNESLVVTVGTNTIVSQLTQLSGGLGLGVMGCGRLLEG